MKHVKIHGTSYKSITAASNDLGMSAYQLTKKIEDKSITTYNYIKNINLNINLKQTNLDLKQAKWFVDDKGYHTIREAAEATNVSIDITRHRFDNPKFPNYIRTTQIQKHPRPPKPPLTRMLNENKSCGTCPKCGSSLEKKTKWIFFTGSVKCINPRCNYKQ